MKWIRLLWSWLRPRLPHTTRWKESNKSCGAYFYHLTTHAPSAFPPFEHVLSCRTFQKLSLLYYPRIKLFRNAMWELESITFGTREPGRRKVEAQAAGQMIRKFWPLPEQEEVVEEGRELPTKGRVGKGFSSASPNKLVQIRSCLLQPLTRAGAHGSDFAGSALRRICGRGWVNRRQSRLSWICLAPDPSWPAIWQVRLIRITNRALLYRNRDVELIRSFYNSTHAETW